MAVGDDHCASARQATGYSRGLCAANRCQNRYPQLNEYAESLAELAICAFELNTSKDARRWRAAFDPVATHATDNTRLFMFLLDRVLGYDRRIQRLLELAGPSSAPSPRFSTNSFCNKMKMHR